MEPRKKTRRPNSSPFPLEIVNKMKLVIGLGNPGRKYKGTRHNIGFDVIGFLAEKFNVGRPKSKFNAEIAETIINTEKTVLLCPLTYMNLSGQSVRAALDFYKLEPTELIVVCDDLALNVARIRLRPGGSAGGQKGLVDIIKKLGSQDFARLRVGIGKPPNEWDPADYVLGRFTEEEKPAIQEAIMRSADAIELWASMGIESAMNKFNPDPNKKPKQQTEKKGKLESASLPIENPSIQNIKPEDNQ